MAGLEATHLRAALATAAGLRRKSDVTRVQREGGSHPLPRGLYPAAYRVRSMLRFLPCFRASASSGRLWPALRSTARSVSSRATLNANDIHINPSQNRFRCELVYSQVVPLKSLTLLSKAALVKRGSRSEAQRFSHSTREFPSSRSRRNINLIHTCTGRPYEFKCAFSGGYAVDTQPAYLVDVDTDVLLTWQNTVTGEITSLRRYMTFWPPSSPDPKYPRRGIMWVNHKQWKLHSHVALADRADTGDVLDAEYKLSRRATTAWEMRRQGVQRDCEDAPPTRCFLP